VTPDDPRVAAAQAATSAPSFDPSTSCHLCAIAHRQGKHKYCGACRRRVESCKCRQQAAGPESLQYFVACEKMADPTNLRCMVFDFDDSTNADGTIGGHTQPRRGSYDCLVYKEPTFSHITHVCCDLSGSNSHSHWCAHHSSNWRAQ
jgi:hypothetical protein